MISENLTWEDFQAMRGITWGPWERTRIWRPRTCGYCYKLIRPGRTMRHYEKLDTMGKWSTPDYQHEHCVFLSELIT